MIGGYLYRNPDADLESRLSQVLGDASARIDVWNNGYLFHNEPFADEPCCRLISDDLIALSGDLLVTEGTGGEYRRFDLAAELPRSFPHGEAAALDAIASDYRMAVVRRRNDRTTLFLASNRAGSGRIYYHTAETGVLFSSDLRFLLRVVGCEVSRMGIYAILKYGAVPDPLTISSNVKAVPPAHYLEHDLNGGTQRTRPFFRLGFDCEEEEADGRSDGEILRPARETLQRSSRFLQERRPSLLISGGIDSSLYGCYLAEAGGDAPRGFYCVFGDDDPELEFARAAAGRIGSDLHVALMEKPDALDVLSDVTRLTDHPFSDFSSLPIAFLLKYVRERVGNGATVVECNGGDDCFGFPDLGGRGKATIKHRFPRILKSAIAAALSNRPNWKWESHEGLLARLSALADTHEATPLDYALVLSPMNYLGLESSSSWDVELSAALDSVFSGCATNYEMLSYEAKTTVRQLIHVNSRRWAAKALSVGESLGLRIVYPFIWREVLVEQGRIPWDAKVRDGIVKWPLKRLLEEFMPRSFIYRKKSGFVPPFATWLTHADFNGRARDVLLDRNAFVTDVVPAGLLDRLLTDAASGRALRHSVLNFLWGALFTEMWLREHGRGKTGGPEPSRAS